MTLKSFVKTLTCGLFLVALSGCGADDIQLNGKIFDAVGMNTGSVKKEAKVAERSPLVVPPGLDKLPEPGANGAAAQANTVPGVEDHDAKRETSQAELEKQQAAYCKVNYEQAKARGDNEANSATGPLGPCRSSVFTSFQKWNGEGEVAQ